MQQYDTENQIPGIYRQEILSAVTPELLTGVPAFLGLARVENPEPKLLRLWTEFEQYFGKPEGFLDRTVRGFFENGGRLCYVVSLENNTLAELQKGLESIEALDTIDLVCAPDIMQNPEQAIAMQSAVLEHCNQMGDRFAILDALNVANIGNIQRLESNNGALYAPWLKVENVAGYIPPCGHIAGIYARSDLEVGVHRAPANFLLEGVLDLSVNFSNSESAPGVNCIRSFRGRGIRVWGARTLSQIAQWEYINVRRLFLTFGRWVERNLADVVFEPNNFQLWVRLERELSVYCQSLWQQGALQGDAPQEAFYVKCDAETNPPELRNTGKVVTEIGLAPTIPNEFIVVSLVQNDSGVTFG